MTDCGKEIIRIIKFAHLYPASYDHATDLMATQQKKYKYSLVQYSNNIPWKKYCKMTRNNATLGKHLKTKSFSSKHKS